MLEAICDTSVIQYLHQVGHLNLLTYLYTRIIVPPAVVEEIERGRERGIRLTDLKSLPWIELRAPTSLGAAVLPDNLGAGERQILALRAQFRDAVVILDDPNARRAAGALGLSCTGTLGILMRAKSESIIGELAPILDRLDSLGFPLSASTRAAVLKQGGESRSPL